MSQRPLSPFVLLRLEGAALFLGAAAAYAALGLPGLGFALLLFAPDLSMMGYLRGPALGAAAYNLVHTLLWPVLLIGLGAAASAPGMIGVGLIWSAHLGMDRALGYGLKYPTAFKDTHLSRV